MAEFGSRLQRIIRFVREEMWDVQLDPRSWAGRAVSFLQFSVMIGQGFVRDMLLLRASALTYFTVLSLVPMIAVMVSIANAVGVTGNFAEAIVDNLAAGSPDAREKILEIIENVNFGALGTLGAAMLFLTTVLAIGNIEHSFNHIWGVKKGRTWARRLPDYLAVLVIAPILTGAALSARTTLESQTAVQYLLSTPGLSTLYGYGLGYLPTLVLGLAFSFLIWFLPNTKVNALSAILGGVIAAVLVAGAQNAYLGLQIGVARANTVFGTFYAIPLLFVWLYCFWAIVLFGAEVAFAHQNLNLYRDEVRGHKAGPADREAIALSIALEIARAFRDRSEAWTSDSLAEALNVPVRAVRDLLGYLEGGGIVSRRLEGDSEAGVQLGRPADQIQLTEVIASVRGIRKPLRGDLGVTRPVEAVLATLNDGELERADGRTLADLVAEIPPRPQGDPEGSRAAGSVDPSAGRG
jgi:membrane protein